MFDRHALRRRSFLLFGCLLACVLPASASGFWKWTDDRGQTHIVDSLEKVPAQYRARAVAPDAAAAEAAQPAPKPPASAPEATPKASAEPGRIEIPYETGSRGDRVIVPVTLNGGVTVPMAVDTGSPGMIIDVEVADRIGALSSRQGALAILTGGIGGTARAIRTIVDSVSVGGASDTFVPTKVVTLGDPEFKGLVGIDFISNYDVRIDSTRHVLVLDPRPPDPEARGGHPEAWWRQLFAEFKAARDTWEQQARADRYLGDLRTFVRAQAAQSERLYLRLESHASANNVPREWR